MKPSLYIPTTRDPVGCLNLAVWHLGDSQKPFTRWLYSILLAYLLSFFPDLEHGAALYKPIDVIVERLSSKPLTASTASARVATRTLPQTCSSRNGDTGPPISRLAGREGGGA